MEVNDAVPRSKLKSRLRSRTPFEYPAQPQPIRLQLSTTTFRRHLVDTKISVRSFNAQPIFSSEGVEESLRAMANPLADCVSSLRSSNHLLSNSISILDSGVNDFPRLAKVLQTTKVDSLV